MKRWVSGSAALAPETWQDFRGRFGHEITEGSGLTKTGATGCINPADGPRELDDHSRARLGSFKTPGYHTIVEALPRNLVGKVLGKELRGMAGERE